MEAGYPLQVKPNPPTRLLLSILHGSRRSTPSCRLAIVKRLLRSLLFFPLSIADWYARLLSRIRPDWAWAASDLTYARTSELVTEVIHKTSGKDVSMSFYTPNAVCRYRANTFSSKEPETLAWIDRYGKGGGAFFDVGANVGLYSVYFAKTQLGTTYAFEPSVLNLALLAKNVSVNELSDRVVIVPTPLTRMNQVSAFHLSMLDEGGSMSTFGADFGHDGKPLIPKLSYDTPGLRLDFLVESGIVPEVPQLMKIDVDGIEHYILGGATGVLSAPELRSILIEVNEDFRELAEEVSTLLSAAGFIETARDLLAESGRFSATYNQIWVKN